MTMNIFDHLSYLSRVYLLLDLDLMLILLDILMQSIFHFGALLLQEFDLLLQEFYSMGLQRLMKLKKCMLLTRYKS